MRRYPLWILVAACVVALAGCGASAGAQTTQTPADCGTVTSNARNLVTDPGATQAEGCLRDGFTACRVDTVMIFEEGGLDWHYQHHLKVTHAGGGCAIADEFTGWVGSPSHGVSGQGQCSHLDQRGADLVVSGCTSGRDMFIIPGYTTP
ncbi:MAG TPA: hypothetical protein VF807_07805 [Ktedonobacterales bacterium]